MRFLWIDIIFTCLQLPKKTVLTLQLCEVFQHHNFSVSLSHFIDSQRNTLNSFQFHMETYILEIALLQISLNGLPESCFKKKPNQKKPPKNSKYQAPQMSHSQKQYSFPHIPLGLQTNTTQNSFMLSSMFTENFRSDEALNCFIPQHMHICWLVFYMNEKSLEKQTSPGCHRRDSFLGCINPKPASSLSLNNLLLLHMLLPVGRVWEVYN